MVIIQAMLYQRLFVFEHIEMLNLNVKINEGDSKGVPMSIGGACLTVGVQHTDQKSCMLKM